MSEGNGKIPSTRLDRLVAQYIQLRDRKKEINNICETEIAPVEALMQQITGLIFEIFDATGVRSARTESGTAATKIDTTASVHDPDTFMEMVRREERFELLNRSANKTACEEYAEENGNPPPGVTLNRRRIISVTRAK